VQFVVLTSDVHGATSSVVIKMSLTAACTSAQCFPVNNNGKGITTIPLTLTIIVREIHAKNGNVFNNGIKTVTEILYR